MSVLKLPYLRRTDDIDKPPLLSLVLSGQSFLAADLRDVLHGPPLYSTTTSNLSTSVLRASTKIADINWPANPMPKSKGRKAPDGVLLQLPGAERIAANNFLKPSTSMDRPRKFRLPHYSHNMKWQKRTSGYWCTTSTVKGPIATYEPPTDDLPGRLTVYETLQDEHDISPMPAHRGVSTLLLDYLFITCILLVTDSQECMAQSSAQGTLSDSNSNTDCVWKKIAQGQYLFRSPPPANAQDSTSADYANGSATPTPHDQDQVLVITQNDPLYPQSQQASTSYLSLSSESDNGKVSPSIIDVPSAARADSPIRSSPVSSQTYIGSSLSVDGSVPSAPPRSTNEIPERPSSAAPTSTIHQLSVSEGATFPASDQTPRSDSSSADRSSDISLWQRRSSLPSISRSRSVSRPLPRTPATPGIEPSGGTFRRSHSHTRNDRHGVEKPSPSTAVPPLPPMPSVMTRSPMITPTPGRSLPPTPYDLVTGRIPSRTATPTRAMMMGVGDYDGVQLVRKNLESDHEQRGRSSDYPLGWMPAEQSGRSPTRPSFDCPPPPYTSIDFHVPDPGWIPDS